MSERHSNKLSGLILIGGKSSRMGHPKHLIRFNNGETWLERNTRVLGSFVQQVCFSGGGDIPDSLQAFERIADAEGYQGPMAGIMGAMEKYPDRDWLVMACDMPIAAEAAVSWLVEQFISMENAYGLIPKNTKTGRLEPLFAIYRSPAAESFRRAAASGRFALSSICDGENIVSPVIPDSLLKSWSNVNTEDQLNALFSERKRP